ncbi:hypothetical protein [Streptomyces sp. NPDC015350]|uniref:hypothetical protein n=1 Tax=Streptomyces sp. NPDC015350 TaxID=3364955 RepID=UPI003700A57E
MQTRPGDEAARNFLVHRGDYHPTVDDWLAHALATHSGHYADPDTRTAAAALLLAALARTGAPVDDDGLELVGRLAQADPEATVPSQMIWSQVGPLSCGDQIN